MNDRALGRLGPAWATTDAEAQQGCASGCVLAASDWIARSASPPCPSPLRPMRGPTRPTDATDALLHSQARRLREQGPENYDLADWRALLDDLRGFPYGEDVRMAYEEILAAFPTSVSAMLACVWCACVRACAPVAGLAPAPPPPPRAVAAHTTSNNHPLSAKTRPPFGRATPSWRSRAAARRPSRPSSAAACSAARASSCGRPT